MPRRAKNRYVIRNTSRNNRLAIIRKYLVSVQPFRVSAPSLNATAFSRWARSRLSSEFVEGRDFGAKPGRVPVEATRRDPESGGEEGADSACRRRGARHVAPPRAAVNRKWGTGRSARFSIPRACTHSSPSIHAWDHGDRMFAIPANGDTRGAPRICMCKRERRGWMWGIGWGYGVGCMMAGDND
ncbi:hypothetical protein H6P81_020647 [Aristolochia fimbriata]|uniref:Uncharacterized protein n=1 Tax=Aristolochia fimbriata TaxID=158543 RepID=A0AAV7DV05_ARIFI|nr:hypothetical protein H6P81_020647 [Aristolochia fimbriata]